MFAIDFGNGLKLDGEVKTGFAVVTADDGDDDTDDTKVGWYNNGAEQAFRARLTAFYTGDWGGAKIRFRSNGIGGLTLLKAAGYTAGTQGAGGAFYLKYAYGWANFLDKKIVVYGGNIGDALWGLGKLSIHAFDPSLDGITGVRVAFNILDGLTFGFGLPFDQVTYGNYDTTNSVWKAAKEDRTVGAFLSGAVFGGVYTADLFGVAAGLKLNPAIDSKVYGGKPNASGDYAESAMYVEGIAGVEVHPIDPLKVVVDAKFDSRTFDKDWLQTTAPGSSTPNDRLGVSQIGYIRAGLKAQYAVNDKLSAYLKGVAFSPLSKAERKGNVQTIDNIPVSIKNYVGETTTGHDYANGAVETLGDLAIAPEIGVDYKATGTIGVYFRIGTDNALWFAGQEKDGTDPYIAGAGLYVKPGAKITLGTSSIEIFDSIGGIGAAKDENTAGDSISSITNRFQVDFNWSF